MGQPQHFGAEQPVHRVRVGAQGRRGVPGLLVAAVGQEEGGGRPGGVPLVGAGQRPFQQLLEGGPEPEHLLQVRQDRRVPVAYGRAAEGELVDAGVLVVLDVGTGDRALCTRTAP
ncbi:hypothetical protein [Streptomyces sp. TE3672]